jgi:pyridoxal phosphate enzyme (YggS family)
MFEDLPQHLERVRSNIERACERAHRDPSEVDIVAVTKGHPVEAMFAALDVGLLDLGENRVQEALPKLPALPQHARVHLIGRLQTNKVNKAVGVFSSIASVDRVDLLDKIARRAELSGVVQDIWLQVNITHERQKGGCEREECALLFERASAVPSLRVLGLMGMARYQAPERELRDSFASLRRLAGELSRSSGRTLGLSMGMSDDYEIAVEEGSTQLRLGTVLLGARA